MRGRIATPAWVPALQGLQRRVCVRGQVSLAAQVHIGLGSVVWAPESLSVGAGVYIGRFCTIECDGEIGAGTLIGNHVALVGRSDHDWRAVGVPVARAPWIGNADYHGPGSGQRLLVGPDVWIGHGAVLLSGITVGRGAVIGAGSVVAGDVEPYAIVAGNPARPVGVRFTEDERAEHERLLAARWGIPARAILAGQRRPRSESSNTP